MEQLGAPQYWWKNQGTNRTWPLLWSTWVETKWIKEIFLTVPQWLFLTTVYVKATKSDRIYFWCKHARNDLPDLPLPDIQKQSHKVNPGVQCDEPHIIHGAVDYDWAGASNHQKSVAGIVIGYTGGTIYYKLNSKTLLQWIQLKLNS